MALTEIVFRTNPGRNCGIQKQALSTPFSLFPMAMAMIMVHSPLATKTHVEKLIVMEMEIAHW